METPKTIAASPYLMQLIWNDFHEAQNAKMPFTETRRFQIQQDTNLEILVVANQDVMDDLPNKLTITMGDHGRFLFGGFTFNVNLYLLRVTWQQLKRPTLRGSTRVHALFDSESWDAFSKSEENWASLNNSLVTVAHALNRKPLDLVHILEK